MYNDNKHPNEWSRGRRDFPRERDERYARRDYYNTPYSPKRRKIDNGDVDSADFGRTAYSPYDVPVARAPVQRGYYKDPYEPGHRRLHDENHYYRPEYPRSREYQQPRRYPEALEPPTAQRNVLLDPERKGEPYPRRVYDPQVDVGRKRPHPDPPNPFLQRQFETRPPISPNTPIKHLASPALTVGAVRDIYDPLQHSNNDDHRSSSETVKPANKATEPLNTSNDPENSEDEPETLSKQEIIENMDQLDNQISQVEEEIEHLKTLKTESQRKTDKSKLSYVDKILLANQDTANANAEYMKLFQKVDVTSKTKANVVHLPDNANTHRLKRPVMMQHMRRALLKSKEKAKRLAREFEIKRKKWNRKLEIDNILPPKSITELNNTITSVQLSPMPLDPPARPGRRNRATASDAVRSEAEFTQVMQQLNDTERQDPNLRYQNSLCAIPPLLLDQRDVQRKFIDNNRFVEDCSVEYRKHQLSNPWNTEEQNIFLRKYITYPKQFAKIASFLPNKSIGDVISYYFLNKHRLKLKAIIEDIQMKKRPQRVRSLPRKEQIAPPSNSSNSSNAPISPFVSREVADLHSSNNDSAYWSVSPRERNRQKPEAMRRERTSQRTKTTKTKTRAKSPRRSSVSKKTKVQPTSAGIDQLCFVANLPAPWNESEINQFKIGLATFGSDFKAISEFVDSKNHWQCRSFFYNFKEQLNLAELFANGVRPITYPTNEPQTDDTHMNDSTSSQKSTSTSSSQSTITPQNWILEEPAKPETIGSSFLPVGLPPSISCFSKQLQGIGSGVTQDVSVNSSASSINIRHSFDSFSPLQNDDTKSSVTWNVAGDHVPSRSLRHSYSDISLASKNIPSLTNSLLQQSSSVTLPMPFEKSLRLTPILKESDNLHFKQNQTTSSSSPQTNSTNNSQISEHATSNTLKPYSTAPLHSSTDNSKNSSQPLRCSTNLRVQTNPQIDANSTSSIQSLASSSSFDKTKNTSNPKSFMTELPEYQSSSFSSSFDSEIKLKSSESLADFSSEYSDTVEANGEIPRDNDIAPLTNSPLTQEQKKREFSNSVDLLNFAQAAQAHNSSDCKVQSIPTGYADQPATSLSAHSKLSCDVYDTIDEKLLDSGSAPISNNQDVPMDIDTPDDSDEDALHIVLPEDS